MAITYGTKGGDTYWDIRGKAEDTKPVDGVPNGSTYTEINNGGQEYLFDADNAAWNLKTAASGGGGTVTAGVSTFNNRSGAVMPQTGDYTADMVGADPAGSAASALKDVNTQLDSALKGKQDILTGVPGQIIGFDAEGNAAATDFETEDINFTAEFALTESF